ncbi:hypothetical protein DPEC_G00214810 [Dallia pectoralis]|uniref:Uncharacterized protein n=1 Tax=Dallia pectoralis TaxID=75939 RepID=A0ACC2G2C4_DALPE|nr:hypothetical protein DPEC_G00214810 [Dallia pectoralis]
MSLTGGREDRGTASEISLSGEHDTTAKSPIQLERPTSPVPSCVSMKSDRSMNPPVTFREGDFSTDQRPQFTSHHHIFNLLQIESPTHHFYRLSHLLIPGFIQREQQLGVSLRMNRATSFKMSLTGGREDRGTASEISLSGEHDTTAIRDHKKRPTSPVPSCVSMKSDQSMGCPITFRKGVSR